MKLAEWLRQTPSVEPDGTSSITRVVTESSIELGGIVPIGVFSMFISGRVHLLYMLLEHGIPEDLEQIAHGESLV